MREIAMNRVKPIGSITPYLECYRENREASRDEWEIFWDWKLSVESNGGTIFTSPMNLEASARLVAYLFLYGMGRGSTRLSTVGSTRRFTDVLTALSTPQAHELFGQRFPEVDWKASMFTTVWNDLGSALREIGVSMTSTMRSKILLAVWGEMPALVSFRSSTPRHNL